MKRLLAAALALGLCSEPDRLRRGERALEAGRSQPTELVLKEPVYPKFPQCLEPPADGMANERFYEAQEAYQKEAARFRNGGLDQALRDRVTDFAARSAPLMLEQKAEEKGVEAAAVTAPEMSPTSLAPGDLVTCEMDLDRSFLFVLEVSGVPLLMGVVNDIS